MYISYQWLKDYVEFEGSPEEIERRVVAAGLNVDGSEPVGEDTCYELDVTANRADCFGHVGVARELALQLETELKVPDPQPGGGEDIASWTSVEVEDADLCALYTARGIVGVTIGESPDWLKARLETIGLRPVNNVVDITNFVMMESGQPLHAFDAAKLNERRIVVRRAKPGEKITAIDQREYKLNEENLVIADATRPVAVAGVMGGVDSEISESTTDILLESEIFDPLSVRRTARSLALHSDSSHRFERGVTPAQVDYASRRAAALIAELTGGTVLEGWVAVGQTEAEKRHVTLRLERVEALLGLQLTEERILHLLRGMGFEFDAVKDGVLDMVVPEFRNDIEREVDVLEEIARANGYDNIPTEVNIPVAVAPRNPEVEAERKIRDAMVGFGYQEAMTWSFGEKDRYSEFARHGELVPMLGADGTPDKWLRPSVLPALLDVARVNEGYRVPVDRVMEVSSIYIPGKSDGFDEWRMLGAVRHGSIADLRGDLVSLHERLGLTTTWEWDLTEDKIFTPGRAISIRQGDEIVGWVGELSSALRDRFDLNRPYAVAEIRVEALRNALPGVERFSAFSRFPPMDRDLAVIVDDEVTWKQIRDEAAAAAPDTLESIDFFDLYSGKGIPDGRKSVAFSMRFRSSERTLTSEEVDRGVDGIIKALEDRLAAVWRKA